MKVRYYPAPPPPPWFGVSPTEASLVRFLFCCFLFSFFFFFFLDSIFVFSTTIFGKGPPASPLPRSLPPSGDLSFLTSLYSSFGLATPLPRESEVNTGRRPPPILPPPFEFLQNFPGKVFRPVPPAKSRSVTGFPSCMKESLWPESPPSA